MYNLIVPAGIGDFSWMYSKLVGLGKEINLTISCDAPKRLGPYTELLPLVKSVNYDGPTFPVIREKAIKNVSELVEDTPIYIEANTHLERGNKLETWLPELPINKHYLLNLGTLNLDYDYIVIYTSSMGMVKCWNGWGVNEWWDFLRAFNRDFKDYPIVFVGAPWDVDIVKKIVERVKERRMLLIDYSGILHIKDTLSLIKGSKYFLGFPSGLSILANVLGVKATMFYSEQIKNIMGTWADSHNFDERLYENPRTYYKYFRRKMCER